MKNIFIHGLGQDNQSWNNTNMYLNQKGIDTICPNLFEITKTTSKDYKMLYKAFENFCNEQNEKLNLCGLSLGGLLTLDFAKKFPEKVNSIILIGTPYKISKVLFKIQGFIFHIMPKSAFKKIGCSKKEFIILVHSFKAFTIVKDLEKIKCDSLIICGAKDYANMKSAKLLNNDIKNSKIKIISNSSHEVNIDNPKELSNIIYNFWKDKQ